MPQYLDLSANETASKHNTHKRSRRHYGLPAEFSGSSRAQQFAPCGSNICASGGASVGIGNGSTVPSGILDVVGTTFMRDGYGATNSQMAIYGGTFNGISGILIEAEAGNDYNTKRNLALAPWGGMVGIGTPTPQYMLDVNGSGRFAGNVAFTAGLVGIGTTEVTCATTTTAPCKLAVAGAIVAQEVVVNSAGADFVFAPDYKLAPLAEIAEYIHANRHLPDIPPASDARANGVNIGEMQTKLLAKIEELTLHMIQVEIENQRLRDRVTRLERAQHDKPK